MIQLLIHECYLLLCSTRAEAVYLIRIPEHLQYTNIRSRVPCLAQCGHNEKLDVFKEDRHVEDKLKLEAHFHEQSMSILTLW